MNFINKTTLARCVDNEPTDRPLAGSLTRVSLFGAWKIRAFQIPQPLAEKGSAHPGVGFRFSIAGRAKSTRYLSSRRVEGSFVSRFQEANALSARHGARLTRRR